MLEGSQASKTNCLNCHPLSKGFFCGAGHGPVKNIDANKSMKLYKRGKRIFNIDSPVLGLFCIKSGKAKMTHLNTEGKETLIQILGEGDIVGHQNLFTNSKYTTSATALEDCYICFIDKDFIASALKNDPILGLQVIQKISSEMLETQAKIYSMAHKNVRQRLADILLTLSKFFGEKEENRIKLNIKLSRDELGSMIGTVNETVTRFISDFKEQGLITEENKTIYILDEVKLRQFANF